MNTKYIIMLIIIIAFSASVVAAEKMVATQNVDSVNNLMTSANQYYYAVFDGEGDAFVSLRIDVSNLDPETIKTLNVELPGSQISVLGVLQGVPDIGTRCASYQSNCVRYSGDMACTQTDNYGNCIKSERQCLEYQQACTQYFENPYSEPNQYKKIDVTPQRASKSVILPLELIEPIESNGKGTFLIVYKTRDYASNVLGAYDFEFETAKVGMMSSNVRVAITTQQGLILKGQKSQVNYLPDVGTFSKSMASLDVSVSYGQANSELQTLSRSIQYANGYVKTASYLDPYESMTVNGVYSGSWLRLYWHNLLIGVAILVGLIWLAVLGFRKLNVKPQTVVKGQPTQKTEVLQSLLWGLFTALALTVLWIILAVMINLVDNASSYPIRNFLPLLLALFGILVSLAILIGVPFYIGNKLGAVNGLLTMAFMFGWLFLFAIIALMVVSAFSSGTVLY